MVPTAANDVHLTGFTVTIASAYTTLAESLIVHPDGILNVAATTSALNVGTILLDSGSVTMSDGALTCGTAFTVDSSGAFYRTGTGALTTGSFINHGIYQSTSASGHIYVKAALAGFRNYGTFGFNGICSIPRNFENYPTDSTKFLLGANSVLAFIGANSAAVNSAVRLKPAQLLVNKTTGTGTPPPVACLQASTSWIAGNTMPNRVPSSS